MAITGWVGDRPGFKYDLCLHGAEMLARRLEASDLNEAEFCARLSSFVGQAISSDRLNRWLRGYDLPDTEIFIAADTLAGPGFDMKPTRRDVLRGLIGVGALVVGDGFLDGLSVTGSGGGDGPTVDDLEARTRDLVLRWPTVNPREHMLVVGNHQELLVGSLTRPQTAAVERRLHSLAGETALLAGMLNFRSGQLSHAEADWAEASFHAHEAADDDLRAYVLVARSQLFSAIPIDSEVRGDRALQLLDQAHSMTGSNSSPRVRSCLLARKAEEVALLGEPAQADADLDCAATEMARLPAAGDRFGHWGTIDLDGYRGSRDVLLGRCHEAVDLLESALVRAGSQPGRAILLADTGAALAHPEGDVAGACDKLGESFELGVKVGAGEFVRRVLRIRRQHLSNWRKEPAVRRLDERLMAALA
ncbi:MAG: hypothetical protein DLM66_12895 [Candidatus Dormiibacter spiritus]|nr:MAG: hypothetical protein DLM66_12895 [Candidatus Dormibacteraeota bacterium]